MAHSFCAALDKPTAVLPPNMQEAIMEEMEQKQAKKHSRNPLHSRKGSKNSIELGNGLGHESSRSRIHPHNSSRRGLGGVPNGQPGGVQQHGIAERANGDQNGAQGVEVDFEDGPVHSPQNGGENVLCGAKP